MSLREHRATGSAYNREVCTTPDPAEPTPPLRVNPPNSDDHHSLRNTLYIKQFSCAKEDTERRGEGSTAPLVAATPFPVRFEGWNEEGESERSERELRHRWRANLRPERGYVRDGDEDCILVHHDLPSLLQAPPFLL